MKKSVFFLLIILLSSIFIGSAGFSSSVQRGSAAASYNEPNATYTQTGFHEANDVDYYWVSGVSQGDLVLLTIHISPDSYWGSVVYFSNLTVVPNQVINGGGTSRVGDVMYCTGLGVSKAFVLPLFIS